MKTIIALCFLFIALTATHAQHPKSLDEILRKRDSLLTQIVEALQNSRTATEEEVRNATMNLYSFRRDSAKTHPERLQWQERIIATEKESEARMKKRMEIGTTTPLDVLLAGERVCAAEQKLLELQLVK
jgi:uncharacterized protein YlxW (UPF0749 family)